MCSGGELFLKMKPLRVCVIGAGAAGLVAIRHIKNDPGLTGCVFEQTDCIGGIWKYTDKIGNDEFGLPIHSTAYQGLRTNLPKEIMGYLDFPFPDSDHSYISHEEVLSYLNLYSSKHGLAELINFTTRVVNVEPLKSHKGTNSWVVKTENLRSKTISEHHFDAIVICNGHYTKPLVPDIRNLNLFKGYILHSRDYRKPNSFKGKRVVVLGAGPSAVDISIELLNVASKVTLSCKNLVFKTSDLIEIRPRVVAAQAWSLITECGTELDCDILLLCTGYQFDFPFLSPKCGVSVDNGKYVHPLYRQVVNAKLPSMAFVGIPFGVCPFPQFDLQVRYSLKVFKDEIRLPSEEEMMQEIKKMEKDRETKGIPLSHSHKLAERQWDYNKLLAQDIGEIELIKPVVQRVYEKSGMRRLLDSVNYKYDHINILNNDSFEYAETENKPMPPSSYVPTY